MSEIINWPSGLSGRIRGMKAREERILADRRVAIRSARISSASPAPSTRLATRPHYRQLRGPPCQDIMTVLPGFPVSRFPRPLVVADSMRIHCQHILESISPPPDIQGFDASTVALRRPKTCLSYSVSSASHHSPGPPEPSSTFPDHPGNRIIPTRRRAGSAPRRR